MFERKGKYYFMWSEGGWTGPDYSVAYAIAESPMGPFKRIGKILKQDKNIAKRSRPSFHYTNTQRREMVYYISQETINRKRRQFQGGLY
jgi:hypothetical protein